MKSSISGGGGGGSARLNFSSSANTSTGTGTSSGSSALSSVHSASLTLVVLLLLSALPLCAGAPVFLNPSTVQHEQLLNQIDNACSSYLSAERPLRTFDIRRDFCSLMLGVLQKSQDMADREPSKRFLFHYTKPNGAGLNDGTEYLQGPRAIQSRGYFSYRPRNGRRSTEYV
ncbi:neuromedin-U isoform X2 [Hoplias malabaricus]|uniref:neuromedin-U isoform X2 n=1 Tax=Hoplias malabaricus TaxID=27720 RepID=UPI003462F8B1